MVLEVEGIEVARVGCETAVETKVRLSFPETRKAAPRNRCPLRLGEK